MNSKKHLIYSFKKLSEMEVLDKTVENLREMDKRRSIRQFSDEPISDEIIKNIIMTGSSAPSGANKQPWIFCAIKNQEIKAQIRRAAEKEEYDNYHGRMSEEWLKDLEPFDTDWQKPFLEEAPWLIVVFKQAYALNDGAEKKRNYYVNESVGIACGFLIDAIHRAGLATLTHTPSPMSFLGKILQRPENERPFLLLPVGYPKEGVKVPNIKKKPEEEVIAWY